MLLAPKAVPHVTIFDGVDVVIIIYLRRSQDNFFRLEKSAGELLRSFATSQKFIFAFVLLYF